MLFMKCTLEGALNYAGNSCPYNQRLKHGGHFMNEIITLQRNGAYRRSPIGRITLQYSSGEIVDLADFGGRVLIEEAGEKESAHSLVHFVGRNRKTRWWEPMFMTVCIVAASILTYRYLFIVH
jgi:hypothetical protein